MSIYKQIFATASIFAIAASALISPAVSAATGVTITGYSNSNPSYSLCIYGPGQSAANGQLVVSGASSNTINANLPSQPLPNGSTYNLFVQNASNSCTNGTALGSPVSFAVFPNHMTTESVSFSTTTGLSEVSETVQNQSPYYSSNNGNTTVNLCLGSTTPVNITFTDPDNDNLQGSASNTPFSSSFVSNGGTLTYTVYPSTSNTSSLGSVTQQSFTAIEQANQLPATPAPVATTANINFTVVNCNGGTVAPGNAVSSSSMMMSSSSMMVSSSSMMMSSSSMAASAIAAKSSDVVVVEAPTPKGKGDYTVRTGGAY